MNFYIGIEDLAANALIQLMLHDTKNSIDCFVTYQKIEKYGMKVVEVLKKKDEKAVLILSRESTEEVLRDYADFFKEEVRDGASGIALKEGKTINDLIQTFRGYLALDLLKAFVHQQAIDVLVA
jgi:hypothetical protein